MAPGHDWSWLAILISNLKRIAEPSRDRRPHTVEPAEIYSHGMELMSEARVRATEGGYHAATIGRDGLIARL
jgi:hypothetical protein